ncbi:hypothetical protein [Dongia sedimenti]|uniref:Uncharacterized protein n=1 Tax=Dongia sedimenti TaxID=3064282 RepID=A0ABU0YJ59_9PROT|nr:hypothetical protein [Rhodospirillaceae bacterium R-7]
MNSIERTLSGPGHSGACLAADGSGSSGAPRGDDPRGPGIDLGDMLEMGLESLLMHFRRKPGDQVVAEDRTKPRQSEESRRSDETQGSLEPGDK